MKKLFFYITIFCFSYFNAKSFSHLKNEKNTCLQCHGNIPPRLSKIDDQDTPPPLLKESFSMKWKMYEFQSVQSPPFFEIPSLHTVINGETHYHWGKKAMTEIYYNRCIDIFTSGNNFSCQFLSVGEKTFLIKSKINHFDRNKISSCCLWSHGPFWAPRPDVLKNMLKDKQNSSIWRKVDWYELNIPLPGPFGYGVDKLTGNPFAFWFPVISGWVQQNFYDYSEPVKDESYFEIPQECKRPQLCEK